MNKKLVDRQVDETIFRSIPKGHEVGFAAIVDKVRDDPPSVSGEELERIGLSVITGMRLQKLRRGGRVRSVRHGYWKREKDATHSEVSNNQDRRLAHGKTTIVNVADEIVKKSDEMPGLRHDVSDDLVAWLELGMEVQRGR